jgi:hypothetical protein
MKRPWSILTGMLSIIIPLKIRLITKFILEEKTQITIILKFKVFQMNFNQKKDKN